MVLAINTNLSSLMAQLSMKNSTNALNSAIEKMTTGYRINSAGDDAAGYAIASKMEVALSSYNVAENNVMLGTSLLSTASSSLDIITTHLQRMRDLAEQAANETYGDDSIKAIQAEIDQRTEEINRVMSTTEYNGIKLFESPSDTVTGNFIQELTPLTEDEAIAQGYTLIKTADDLNNIRNNLSGKYILMNDIDLSSIINWQPIGDGSNAFTGELNGNGHVIKNLRIDNSTLNTVGLLGSISGATISNLGIENANIYSNYNDRLRTTIGILAGMTLNSEVSNCYISGRINSVKTGSDDDVVGGLLGMTVNTNVQDSYSTANIDAAGAAGGLIGYLYYLGNISNCYATGNVHGVSNAGGLIAAANNCSISNSYATGRVSYTSVGSVYEAEGGLVADTATPGSTDPTIINSYYNKDTTGQSDSNFGSQGVSQSELEQLIANGTLPKSNPAKIGRDISLQVGIDSTLNSIISFNTGVSVSVNINVSTSENARNALAQIDEVLNSITAKQTEFGAVQNRLDSVLNSLNVNIDNTTSSLSTIRDADIAKVSADYIRAQILQQASTSLLATANQAPSIALNLI